MLGKCSRVFAAALGVTVLAAACQRTPRATKPIASSEVQEPDPARLIAAQRDSAARWTDAENLPDCAALLEQGTARAPCSAARGAASAVQAALARQASATELIPMLGEAALTGQRAAQALRTVGVARLFKDAPRLPPSASSSARPPSASAGTGAPSTAPSRTSPPRALGSSPAPALSGLARVQGSEELKLISAYSRLSTIGLRELALYLEFGALPVRRRALAELERLAAAEPHWAALSALVTEAQMVEQDPDLKRGLRRVREQLGPG